MQIVGYYVHGNKEYVAWNEDEGNPLRFKLTDGFHDKQVNERNVGKYKDYHQVDKQDIDLKKIISRLYGARPWHPLLELLRKEGLCVSEKQEASGISM